MSPMIIGGPVAGRKDRTPPAARVVIIAAPGVYNDCFHKAHRCEPGERLLTLQRYAEVLISNGQAAWPAAPEPEEKVDTTGGARKLAEAEGLDLADLWEEGERITVNDVRKALAVRARDPIAFLEARLQARKEEPGAPELELSVEGPEGVARWKTPPEKPPEQESAAETEEALPAPPETPPERRNDGELDKGELLELAEAVLNGENVTPVAKELAVKEDLSLAGVQGTGKDGRITVNDVREALDASR